jgi:hypothetical protein
MWRPTIFKRPKMGKIFISQLHHVIKKRGAVGSCIDGSNHPHTTNTVHVGPTVCLGVTHMDSWDIRVGPTSGGTHTFWFVGLTILLSEISFFNNPKPRGIIAPLIVPHLQQNLSRQIARGWFRSIQEARGLAVLQKESHNLSKLICSLTNII